MNRDAKLGYLLAANLLFLSISSPVMAQAAPGQAAPEGLQGGAEESAPGQADVSGAPEGGGVAGIAQTTLTFRSYPIGPGGSSGNLEGTACPASFKMLSGACHPFYNDHVTIINQFPNIAGNTWRCGFKNNTSVTVTVYIYTLCGK